MPESEFKSEFLFYIFLECEFLYFYPIGGDELIMPCEMPLAEKSS